MPAQSIKIGRKERRELIRAIEEKRGSKVITYITSDRRGLSVRIAGDVVKILHRHILALPTTDRHNVDLFIYSRGGDADVPWTIVSMFREYCKEGFFNVLIPYCAHSAATLIALGADEIVMTKNGELGPIDITIEGGPYNPIAEDKTKQLPVSVEDVMGYFKLLDTVGCRDDEGKIRGYEQLTNKVHPLVLGNVKRLLEQTELVALRLLGTRRNAFPKHRNRKIIKSLSSEIYSHRHVIRRTEARELGLRQITDTEKVGIDDEMWQLFNEYESFFSLDEPFNPEEYLIVNNLDEHSWERQRLASIESVDRLDVCLKDRKVRKLRKTPPNVTLTIQSINPVINLPSNLPSGMTAQQINQMVAQLLQQIIQPAIDNAANRATQALLASLPIGGFENIDFNAKWETVK